MDFDRGKFGEKALAEQRLAAAVEHHHRHRFRLRITEADAIGCGDDAPGDPKCVASAPMTPMAKIMTSNARILLRLAERGKETAKPNGRAPRACAPRPARRRQCGRSPGIAGASRVSRGCAG